MEQAEEQVENSLYDSGRILIYRYLPEQMIPDKMGEVPLGQFYRLLAAAKYARKVYQMDIEQGIINAVNKIFADE